MLFRVECFCSMYFVFHQNCFVCIVNLIYTILVLCIHNTSCVSWYKTFLCIVYTTLIWYWNLSRTSIERILSPGPRVFIERILFARCYLLFSHRHCGRWGNGADNRTTVVSSRFSAQREWRAAGRGRIWFLFVLEHFALLTYCYLYCVLSEQINLLCILHTFVCE